MSDQHMQQHEWALPKAIARWATTVQSAGLPHDSDHALREIQDILLQHAVTEVATLRATLTAVTRERDEAKAYLSRLLTHYAPQCKPLSDLDGVCSQIDNLLVGMAEQEATEAQLRTLMEWAKAERDDWSERNADRFWQMNRVVSEIAKALLRPAPAPQEPIG